VDSCQRLTIPIPFQKGRHLGLLSKEFLPFYCFISEKSKGLKPKPFVKKAAPMDDLSPQSKSID